MNIKLEEKILAEIRKRTFQKEQERTNLEHADAHREALSDITSLTKREVDRIADEVRLEFERKQLFSKKLKRIISALILLAAVCGGLYWIAHRPSVVLEESFDQAANSEWSVRESFSYKFYMENSAYILEGGMYKKCFHDEIPITLPQRLRVEVKSVWINGKYDNYGFYFIGEKDDRGFFMLKADGTAAAAVKTEGEWKTKYNWKKGQAYKGDGSAMNIQRVDIYDGAFKYYANGKFVQKGDIDVNRFDKVGFMMCDKQKVAYKHLKITSLDSSGQGETLMEDSFMNADAGWAPRVEKHKKMYFENGQYMMSVDIDNECYGETNSIAVKGDFDVILDTIWQKGEQAPYSFALQPDQKTRMAFELQNNRTARFVMYKEGQEPETGNTSFQTFGQLKGVDKSKVRQIVKVRSGWFRYYVNDTLIEKGKMPMKPIKIISFAVCGHQTVAFDYLRVENR